MTPQTRLSDLDFRINHTMLPVSDLDRSVDFYTGLLGMKLARRNVSEARKVAVGLVGYGDGTSGPFLELTQKLGDDRPSCVSPTGVHIGIDVSDLRALCRTLEKEGVSFIRPLGPTSRPGSRELRAWIADPDGHELELAERYPEG